MICSPKKTAMMKQLSLQKKSINKKLKNSQPLIGLKKILSNMPKIRRMIGDRVTQTNWVFNKKKKSVDEESKSKSTSLYVENQYQDNEGVFSIYIHTRSDKEVRNNYINKLIQTKQMNEKPSKKHQTFNIFDWDDTLLCTNYLGSYGFIDLPDDVCEQLSLLNESASKLLQKAVLKGDTYIITNAAQGWVEYSSKLYLPKVNEAIFQNKITVISARHGYEELFPGDCSKWKIEAFKSIRSHYDQNLVTNIICLGDNHIEIDAAHVLAKEFNFSLIKTIKFRENPKPEELIKQQELVYDKFEQIYSNIKSLTIRLEKKGN